MSWTDINNQINQINNIELNILFTIVQFTYWESFASSGRMMSCPIEKVSRFRNLLTTNGSSKVASLPVGPRK